MQELEMVRVRTGDSVPKNTIVQLPAGIGKRLQQHEFDNFAVKKLRFVDYRKFRVLPETEVIIPRLVLKFLQEDRRYENFVVEVFESLEDAPPPPDDPVDDDLNDDPGDPESPAIEAALSDADPVQDDLYAEEDVHIFDLWERSDIEKANLHGDEGLKAYAEYMGFDLEGKTLLAEVRQHILDRFDNVQ